MKKIIAYLPLAFLSLFSFTAASQHISSADSIISVLKKTSDDTTRIKLQLQLANFFSADKPDTSFILSNQSLLEAKQIHYLPGMAGAMAQIGDYYQGNNIDSAMHYYISGQELYFKAGMPDEANTVKNKLCYDLWKTQKYTTCLEMAQELITYFQHTGNKDGEADAHKNAAIAHWDLKDKDQAKHHFEKSIELQEQLKNFEKLALALSNLAVFFELTDKPEEAYKIDLKIVEIGEKSHNQFAIDRGNERLGDYYNEMKDFKKALHHNLLLYKSPLLERNLSIKSQTEIFISELYSKLGDYKSGLQYLHYSIVHGDSFMNAERLKSIDELEAKYKNKEKQIQIELLNNKAKLIEAEAGEQKAQKGYILFTFLIVALVALIAFYDFRNRVNKKQQAERARISRDLHDDVGATLSSISIYSEAAHQKLKNKNTDDAGNLLERISTDAQEMVSVMSDFIWTLNPSNDSFQKITDRMQSYASPVLSAKNIRMNFDADAVSDTLSLKPEVRKNIYLIFKEAVNNAAKYSNASEVTVGMKNGGKTFEMIITDNGNGFDTSVSSEGNGLRNMKERAEEINAVIRINSDKSGTLINVVCPV